jgi:hypothetical protein
MAQQPELPCDDTSYLHAAIYHHPPSAAAVPCLLCIIGAHLSRGPLASVMATLDTTSPHL